MREELEMDNLEFHHFINEKSIQVITPAKELKTLHCPFTVIDKTGNRHRVTAIAAPNNSLYYLIDGNYHYYNGYSIINDSES